MGKSDQNFKIILYIWYSKFLLFSRRVSQKWKFNFSQFSPANDVQKLTFILIAGGDLESNRLLDSFRESVIIVRLCGDEIFVENRTRILMIILKDEAMKRFIENDLQLENSENCDFGITRRGAYSESSS